MGDAPSRAPADREVSRNLHIPIDPIRDTMCRMFWAPDELGEKTEERVNQLKINNPGVLTYLPETLLAQTSEALQQVDDEEWPEAERAT